MKFVSLFQIQLIAVGIACTSQVSGFSPRFVQWRQPQITSKIVVLSHPNADSVMEKSSKPESYSFIDTELRGAAMRLHTRSQAPKEGEATEKPKPKEPYVTTHEDYLKFLVDSQHVYKAFEETTIGLPALAPFCDTGLERVGPLEKDIEFMVQEFGLTRPSVGKYGEDYAQVIRDIAAKGEEHVPEYICHFYNHYFAHTAGGRMIGKQMSALLLDKKTLEFYKVCQLSKILQSLAIVVPKTTILCHFLSSP